MLKELISLANHLDSKGLKKEADFLDFIIRKASEDKWVKTNDIAMGDMPIWKRLVESGERKAFPPNVDPNNLPDTSSKSDETVTGESTQKKNDYEAGLQFLRNTFTTK